MNKRYLLNVLIILVFIVVAVMLVYYNLYTSNMNKNKQNKVMVLDKIEEMKNQEMKSVKDKNIYTKKILDQPYINCIKGNPSKDNTKLYEIYLDFNKNRDSNNYLTKNKKNNSPIGPANLFIMRHTEDNNDVPLNHNGILRSIFNIDLIKGFNNLGYGIDYIVTVNPGLISGFMHMQQSIFMISYMLNIPIFIFGSSKQSELVITQVYKNIIFNNKNVLFCWKHQCIQELVSNIIKIGPNVKKIPNQAFLNKNGKLELPYWGKNNYETIIHIDDNFKEHLYYTGIKTCTVDDNIHLEFGKVQICEGRGLN